MDLRLSGIRRYPGGTMTVREIVTFPDLRLRQPARAITAFDDRLNAFFSADLLDTVRAAPGIGITGPILAKHGALPCWS